MQPDTPIEPSQHPIDYLDSISTVPKGVKKGPSDKLFFGSIIAVLLLALFVGMFALFASGDDGKADLTTLSVRLKNLQKVAEESQENTVSSRIRGTNSSLTLVLTNVNHDVTEQLTESGIDPEKINPKITEEENTDDLTERLEDARLNGIFDRIYAREMSYELDTVLILIEQLQSKTKSDSQKEFLTTTYENLKPLQQQLSKFDATTS